jgi:hypothetical protein
MQGFECCKSKDQRSKQPAKMQAERKPLSVATQEQMPMQPTQKAAKNISLFDLLQLDKCEVRSSQIIRLSEHLPGSLHTSSPVVLATQSTETKADPAQVVIDQTFRRVCLRDPGVLNEHTPNPLLDDWTIECDTVCSNDVSFNFEFDDTSVVGIQCVCNNSINDSFDCGELHMSATNPLLDEQSFVCEPVCSEPFFSKDVAFSLEFNDPSLGIPPEAVDNSFDNSTNPLLDEQQFKRELVCSEEICLSFAPDDLSSVVLPEAVVASLGKAALDSFSSQICQHPFGDSQPCAKFKQQTANQLPVNNNDFRPFAGEDGALVACEVFQICSESERQEHLHKEFATMSEDPWGTWFGTEVESPCLELIRCPVLTISTCNFVPMEDLKTAMSTCVRSLCGLVNIVGVREHLELTDGLLYDRIFTRASSSRAVILKFDALLQSTLYHCVHCDEQHFCEEDAELCNCNENSEGSACSSQESNTCSASSSQDNSSQDSQQRPIGGAQRQENGSEQKRDDLCDAGALPSCPGQFRNVTLTIPTHDFVQVGDLEAVFLACRTSYLRLVNVVRVRTHLELTDGLLSDMRLTRASSSRAVCLKFDALLQESCYR